MALIGFWLLAKAFDSVPWPAWRIKWPFYTKDILSVWTNLGKPFVVHLAPEEPSVVRRSGRDSSRRMHNASCTRHITRRRFVQVRPDG